MAELRKADLAKIKQLTADRQATQPTVSFNPQAPDTITPMVATPQAPTVTPSTVSPKYDVNRIKELTAQNLASKANIQPTVQPTYNPVAGIQYEAGSPESIMQDSATQQREVINELIKKFSTTATESSYDMYKRMREEEGLSKLIEGRNDVFKTVQTTMDALDQLEETIANEGAEIGTLTKAQLGNITGKEGKELTKRLNTANNLLQSYNLSIGDVESKIEKLMAFDRQDKADEIERLVNLANYTGLTEAEKELVAYEIDKKLKEDEKAEATLEQKQETLDSGITALREMATGAGVITGKFAEVAREAQRRLDAGEDPQAILADVSAAVLNNETLQRQFEIQRIAAEQSIVARSSGGGSGGGSSSSTGLSSKIASLVALTGVEGQEDYLQSQLDKLSPAEMVEYISALSGDTGDEGGGDPIQDTVDYINSRQTSSQLDEDETEAKQKALNKEITVEQYDLIIAEINRRRKEIKSTEKKLEEEKFRLKRELEMTPEERATFKKRQEEESKNIKPTGTGRGSTVL